jgi:hypothetical protein
MPAKPLLRKAFTAHLDYGLVSISLNIETENAHIFKHIKKNFSFCFNGVAAKI